MMFLTVKGSQKPGSSKANSKTDDANNKTSHNNSDTNEIQSNTSSIGSKVTSSKISQVLTVEDRSMMSFGAQQSDNQIIKEKQLELLKIFNKQKERFMLKLQKEYDNELELIKKSKENNQGKQNEINNRRNLILTELNLDYSKMNLGFYLFEDEDFSGLFFKNYKSGEMQNYIKKFKKIGNIKGTFKDFKIFIENFKIVLLKNEFGTNEIFKQEIGFLKKILPNIFANKVERDLLSIGDGEINDLQLDKSNVFQIGLLETAKKYFENITKKKDLIKTNNLANLLFRQNLEEEEKKYKEYYNPLKVTGDKSSEHGFIVSKFCEKFSRRDIHDILKYFAEMPNILSARNFIDEIKHDRYNIFSFIIFAPYMNKFYRIENDTKNQPVLKNIFLDYDSEQFNYATIQNFLLNYNFTDKEIKDIYEKFVFLCDIYTDCLDTITPLPKDNKYSIVYKTDYIYQFYENMSRLRENIKKVNELKEYSKPKSSSQKSDKPDESEIGAEFENNPLIPNELRELINSVNSSYIFENLLKSMQEIQLKIENIEKGKFNFNEICNKILIKFSKDQYIPKGGLGWDNNNKNFTLNIDKIKEAAPKKLQDEIKINYINEISIRNEDVIKRKISGGDNFNRFLNVLYYGITEGIESLELQHKNNLENQKKQQKKPGELVETPKYSLINSINSTKIEEYSHLSLEEFINGNLSIENNKTLFEDDKITNNPKGPKDVKIKKIITFLDENLYESTLSRLQNIQKRLMENKSKAVNNLNGDVEELINTVAKSLYYNYKLINENNTPIEKSKILDLGGKNKDGKNLLQYILRESINSFSITTEEDLKKNKRGIFLTAEADLEYYKSKKSGNVDKAIIRALVLKAFLKGEDAIEYNGQNIPLCLSCFEISKDDNSVIQSILETRKSLLETLKDSEKNKKSKESMNNDEYNRLKLEITNSFETINHHENSKIKGK